MRYFTIRKELQDANPYDILPKRKSFTIGELENSGFNKTQLHPVGIIHIKRKPEREGERESTYLRKYSKPTRRFSRNFDRNLTSKISIDFAFLPTLL